MADCQPHLLRAAGRHNDAPQSPFESISHAHAEVELHAPLAAAPAQHQAPLGVGASDVIQGVEHGREQDLGTRLGQVVLADDEHGQLEGVRSGRNRRSDALGPGHANGAAILAALLPCFCAWAGRVLRPGRGRDGMGLQSVPSHLAARIAQGRRQHERGDRTGHQYGPGRGDQGRQARASRNALRAQGTQEGARPCAPVAAL